jgi:serine/threonine protein kinase
MIINSISSACLKPEDFMQKYYKGTSVQNFSQVVNMQPTFTFFEGFLRSTVKWKCSDESLDCRVVVKQCLKTKSADSFKNELKMFEELQDISTNQFLWYFGCVEYGDMIYSFVYDYGNTMVPFGEVNEDEGPWKKKLEPKEQIKVMHKIANALASLHERNITFNDVRIKNILVNELREGDFEVVFDNFFHSFKDNEFINGGNKRFNDLEKNQLFVPIEPQKKEELTSREDHQKADIWALGVTFYELCRGKSGRNLFFEKYNFYTVKKIFEETQKSVLASEWLKEQGLDLCSTKTRDCFSSILKDMMKERNKRSITAKQIGGRLLDIASNPIEADKIAPTPIPVKSKFSLRSAIKNRIVIPALQLTQDMLKDLNNRMEIKI